MKTLEQCLATVSDPRRAQGRRYDLVHALLYCVLAVSAGGGNDHKYGKLGLDAATLEATAAQIQSQVSLGRFGTPQELVTTVLHLAVPESAFIVGTEAIVDGGMSQL